MVLNSTRHHAHVRSTDDHHHTERLQHLLHRLCNLVCDSLLHLQPLREATHQLRCLCFGERTMLLLLLKCAAAAAVLAAARQHVRDVHSAMEWQHVVLTLRHEWHMMLYPLLLLLLWVLLRVLQLTIGLLHLLLLLLAIQLRTTAAASACPACWLLQTPALLLLLLLCPAARQLLMVARS
jgi:hypothetical protein